MTKTKDKPRPVTAKRRPRRVKKPTRAVQEFAAKYQAWCNDAEKVLAAKELMNVAGGYKEAFVLLDAVLFSLFKDQRVVVPWREPERAKPATDPSEMLDACRSLVHKVLAAERLLRLANGYDEAFFFLDAVMVAMKGDKGIKDAKEVRGTAGDYHTILAEKSEDCKSGH